MLKVYVGRFVQTEPSDKVSRNHLPQLSEVTVRQMRSSLWIQVISFVVGDPPSFAVVDVQVDVFVGWSLTFDKN